MTHTELAGGGIAVWKRQDGYWAARVRIYFPGGECWERSSHLFHDEPEASDWADAMLDVMQDTAGDES